MNMRILKALTFSTAIMLALLVAVLPVGLVGGCHNPSVQSIGVKTLGSVHETADAAYKSYMSAVFDHVAPTNDVPAVTRAYVEFQTAFSLAVVAVQGNTNAPVPQAFYDSAARLTTAIQSAKGK